MITEKSIAKYIADQDEFLSKSEVEDIINACFSRIAHEMKEGNPVRIKGFGTFSAVKGKANEYVFSKVSFRASTVLKKRIKNDK